MARIICWAVEMGCKRKTVLLVGQTWNSEMVITISATANIVSMNAISTRIPFRMESIVMALVMALKKRAVKNKQSIRCASLNFK